MDSCGSAFQYERDFYEVIPEQIHVTALQYTPLFLNFYSFPRWKIQGTYFLSLVWEVVPAEPSLFHAFPSQALPHVHLVFRCHLLCLV